MAGHDDISVRAAEFVEEKRNRLITSTPPWTTRSLHAPTMQVIVLGSAAIHVRSSGERRVLAKGYQPLARRSHSLPSSKPQPQPSAAAASCSSQLPAIT
jgi:hypothetical protein